jgi:hypothetical protein
MIQLIAVGLVKYNSAGEHQAAAAMKCETTLLMAGRAVDWRGQHALY